MTKIKELMDEHIIAVSKNTSLGSALKLMKQAMVNVLPVLDGIRLVGLLSSSEIEREIERWGEAKRVGELNLRLLFVELDDKSEDAAKIMVSNKLNRLPVVSTAASMKCVGVISSTEIARNHKEKIF